MAGVKDTPHNAYFHADQRKYSIMRLIIFLLLFTHIAKAQDTDRKIQFPDVEGYRTLKCDLHIHTVFSDGYVWPTIRIDEAVKDGLDAISLTEHLEYQPWSEDIPHPDRNRSYHIATEAAKAHDLLIIHGTEITRQMPPGHANALFITDANTIKNDDAMAAYEEANNQGAFVFWNHPNWVNQEKDGLPQVSDFHKTLLEKKWLHGIEVVNDLTYSEKALSIAQENNMTVIGTSDIHGLVDWQYDVPAGGHRPILLVFGKEKSKQSIKEALFDGRTVAWYYNTLIGNPENIKLLLDACIKMESKGYFGNSSALEIEITNSSDAQFMLHNMSPYDFYQNTDLIEVLPHSTKIIRVLTERVESEKVILDFKVMNTVIGEKKQALIHYEIEK